MGRRPKILAKVLEQISADRGTSDGRMADALAGDDEALSKLAAEVVADVLSSDRQVAQAVTVLRYLPTPAMADCLIRTMKTRPSLARMTGYALRRLQHPAVVRKLKEVVHDQSCASAARAAAVSVIGSLALPVGKEILIAALDAGEHDSEVLCEIAYAIGNIQLREGKTDAASALVKLLDAPSPDVRVAAINSLGNMWARDAVSRIEQLVDDPTVSKGGIQVGVRASAVVAILRTEG